MMRNILAILLLCIVSTSYTLQGYDMNTDNKFIPLEEFTKKFGRNPARLVMKTTTEPPSIIPPGLDVTQSPDPCEPYVIPKDFSAAGRRISESKCLEYIWDIKSQYEQSLREKQCLDVLLNRYLEAHPDVSKTDLYTVYGGRDTLPGEFPHMGAIGWKSYQGTWIFKCGGSLISHKFVLTAAHCKSTSPKDTSVADIEPKIVRFGDKNILDNATHALLQRDIAIARIITHPKYNSPKTYYDIALIELQENVIFTKFIRPACLWTKNSISELGKQGTVTGWGVVESSREQFHPELQAANVDFLDSKLCHKYLSPHYNRVFSGFEDHQLCAGVLTGRIDPCQGDSGGPLQVKIPLPYQSHGNIHYVVGVISFGIKCGLENTPAIYTRVSSFIDWIEPIVWPNETNPHRL